MEISELEKANSTYKRIKELEEVIRTGNGCDIIRFLGDANKYNCLGPQVFEEIKQLALEELEEKKKELDEILGEM